MLAAGIFVTYQFGIFLMTFGQDPSIESFMWPLIVAFAALGPLLLAAGVFVLESDRTSWIENGKWHSTRGLIPIFHKSYGPSDVKAFEVVKKPAFMVFYFGHGFTRVSQTGWRYHLEALVPKPSGKIRRVSIQMFREENDAKKAKQAFEQIL